MAKLSKIIALATVALLSISVFAVLTTVSADSNGLGLPITPIQHVEVSLTGSMDLEWWGTSATIAVPQTNFTANVPPTITAGTLDGKFGGTAHIDANNITFNGMIMTKNGTFSAVFEIPTPTGTQTGECWALGNVTLLISAAPTPPPISVELIQLAGRVTHALGANASGCLAADAKITNDTSVQNTSDVSVSWSPWVPPTASPVSLSAPWNFSFYEARLVNTTAVELDSSENLTVTGYWNVLNVTSGGDPIHAFDFKESTSYVVQNATGTFTSDLTVPGNWTLSITGLSGDVNGSVTRVRLHANRILEGDIFGKGYVDIFDLVYVARLIGATPGAPQWGGPSNFENVQKACVSGDSQVSIYDLVTVATELGQTG